MWPWTTKPVTSVNFSKLRFIKNMLSIDLCLVRIGQYLESEGAKKSKHWENHLKVVQINFSINSYYKSKINFCFIYSRTFTKYLNGTWSLLPNDFWHKIKIYHFDPYNVFLAIGSNIPQRLVLLSRVTNTYIHTYKKKNILFTLSLS